MFKNKGLSGRAGPFFGLPGAIFYLKFSLNFHKLRTTFFGKRGILRESEVAYEESDL